MVVGVSNTAVMLFFVLVFLGIRCGVAAEPELLDKLLAFFVRFQTFESRFFLVCDDVNHVLIQPLLPGASELFFELFLLLRDLLFG